MVDDSPFTSARRTVVRQALLMPGSYAPPVEPAYQMLTD